MVEFLKNSSFYEWKKQKIDISGHIFRQGDIRVKVGILSVNYPKLVVIQVLYTPGIYLREGNFEVRNTQIDELIRYTLRIPQEEIDSKRLKRDLSHLQQRNAKNVAITFEEFQCIQIVEAIRMGQEA